MKKYLIFTILFSTLTAMAGAWLFTAGSLSTGPSIASLDFEVFAKGGYASELFWYPSFVNSPATFGTNIVLNDVLVLRATGQSRIDKQLVVAVDDRPTTYELEPPQGEWSLAMPADGIAILSNDVLVAQGGVGTAQAIFTTSQGVARSVTVPFTQASSGTILKNPGAEIIGTWREAVSTNVIAHFAAADKSITSTYKYHRETTFGTNGVSTWTFPNCFQLYERGGTNSNAPDPRLANASFFWPEVADALRCVSSWRGDWYAHRPFIAVAPHYAISVAHWRQTNTWIPWCVDRATDTWMTNRLASTGNDDPGRVGTTVDISVHRFTEAFPSNILMRFLPSSRLTALSPSMLSGAIGMVACSHNTVHPIQLQPWRAWGLPVSSLTHAPWDSYAAGYDADQWLPRDYLGIGSLVHNTHLWDSGHLSFFWVNGVLVPVGTFTFANGGANALMNPIIVSRLAEIISADSSGAETISLISTEELQ